MRGYFDELSRQRSFLGIQEVLVKEMNNNESRKYAILTTTDSFYRYKEAVKELIDRNLSENEARKQELEGRQRELADEAMDIILLIEREFDAIERRYNKLIEQKTLFASRAAARIRYILMEGALEEDPTAVLVKLLNQSRRSTEILEKLSGRMRLTEPFRMVTGQSLAHRRNMEKTAFAPQAVVRDAERQEEGLDEFVLKPLYTRQEIAEFRRKNERNGAFTVTEDTVRSTEDLEKLFFVWQDAVEIADDAKKIEIGEELENREGCRFSALTIQE